MNRYEEVEKYGLQTRDKKYLLKHLSGEKLTPMQAIRAKCYECMGYFIDGKHDCEIKYCPNYPFFRFNPHRLTIKKELTDEERVKIGERFKKVREAKKALGS
jgi:hypothetical protein